MKKKTYRKNTRPQIKQLLFSIFHPKKGRRINPSQTALAFLQTYDCMFFQQFFSSNFTFSIINLFLQLKKFDKIQILFAVDKNLKELNLLIVQKVSKR